MTGYHLLGFRIPKCNLLLAKANKKIPIRAEDNLLVPSADAFLANQINQLAGGEGLQVYAVFPANSEHLNRLVVIHVSIFAPQLKQPLSTRHSPGIKNRVPPGDYCGATIPE